jgi:predicted ATPase
MNKHHTKGSEWRKWDLHFHTPSSYDYMNMSLTNEDIINGLIANGISVVAITDHHTIDVERIKALQTLSENRGLTILPGIEFLSDARGNEPIHFIGIFDEDSNIEYIWGQIKNRTSINRIEGEQKKINEVYCDLADTVKLIKELGGIVSIHAGSKSNSLENITHSLPQGVAQKEDIARAVDIFELGKVGDIEPYQNLVNPYLLETIKKTLPVIICSDNHNIRNYTQKENLWIKADPTFEGLKQIIYEPEERVSIRARQPDDKNIYDVIEKVRFLDSSFQTEYIDISQNLTSIIGGKSTGRSILLKSIARTADVIEFEKRNKTAGIVDSKPVKGFEVVWKDGQISKLGSENNPAKKIIYIPQSYLNRVVDKSEEDSDIDKIIQDVLLQKDDFKAWYDSLDSEKATIKNEIERLIKIILENFTINITKNKEKKEIGDVEGVKKQIEKLEKEIKDLQDKSSIRDSDRTKFNAAIEQIKSHRVKIANIDADLLQLEKLKVLSLNFNTTALENLNQVSLKENLRELIKTKSTTYINDWQTVINEKITGLQSEKLKTNQAIESVEAGIRDIRSSLKGQDVLNALLKDKEKEEAKLIEIEELSKVIQNSYNQIDSSINSLAELNAQYYSIFLKAKSTLNLDEINQELTFDIETNFTAEKFQKNYVEKFFDSRTTRGKDFQYLTTYNFNNVESHKKFLREELWKIVNGKLPKLENFKKRDLIAALVSNWFKVDYKVSYQNDDINDMSPGKKSFVLLRLLIDLDDSKCPILIDQPEDDLDNRSIYNQVVKFLRKRKKTRQIIIVTHNPNLVLGADAELIVVANQDGEGTKNKAHKFEYVSGSIEYSKAEDYAIAEVLHKRGIQEHICDILEGGPEAFDKRKKKYNF